MAYDPIIDYYDEPGGPHWPSKNGGGGGGGEATLGSMQSPMVFTLYRPVMGEGIRPVDSPSLISDVYVGSQHVIGPFSGEREGHTYYNYNIIRTVASGARVAYVCQLTTPIGTTADDIDVHTYVVTTEVDAAGTPDESADYTSIKELDVESSIVIRHEEDYEGDGIAVSYYSVLVTITHPEIDSDAGEFLVCYVNAPM